NALRTLDSLPVFQLLPGPVELVPQLVEGVESADSHVEDRFDAFLTQAVHNIGTYSRLDGCPDHVGVRVVHEHRNGTTDAARDLKHLFENVAIGILQVDEDNVGVGVHYETQEILHIADHGDVGIAGLAQALLENRGSRDILIHHKNTKGWVGHLGAATAA